MRIALYQPEIPGNVGAVLRLAACFGVGVDVIEPCGFVFSDARMKRAGMDYVDHVALVRHADWSHFRSAVPGRLILLTTKAAERLHGFAFEAGDTLLMGSESAGVPLDIAQGADARLRVAIAPQVRSLNLAVATGIALTEALRQTGGLPE